MPRKKKPGPRQAVRWIGDAWALEGDLTWGVNGIWRGPDLRGKREPRLACIRVVEVYRDWEFGQDELPLHAASAAAAGPGLVPRFTTYRREGDIAIIEEDVADITLRDVIKALRDAGGTAPLGLALYVGAKIAEACRTAESCNVELELRPSRLLVAWDGALYARPRLIGDGFDEDALDEDDPVEDALYWGEPIRVIGLLMYELVAGRHPYVDAEELAAANDDDADVDAFELAEEYRQRVQTDDPLPLDVEGAPTETLEIIERCASLTRPAWTWDDAVAALTELARREQFDQQAFAGMIRGVLAREHEQALVEREERLTVVPGPKVEPEDWGTYDPEDRDQEGEWGDELDLDDVRKGHPDYDAGRPYEPSVEAIDPFDDENKGK